MSNSNTSSITFYAVIVSLGGFLFGFDASVISGALGSIKAMFPMTTFEQGFVVSSPTLSAAIAMLFVGPISDFFGRKKVLIFIAFGYALSAILSALAPSIGILIFARMLGGLAFGAALIMAPLYIAEIAPAEKRGRLVSINQLNIVLGFSAAYFANYFINQQYSSDPDMWRYMLGLEFLPAIIYFFLLFIIPESPRWLIGKNRQDEAKAVIQKVRGTENVDIELSTIQQNILDATNTDKIRIVELFKPSLRLVLIIGLVVGILQQITGINIAFFYANTIFEQSGIGADASFTQAVWVGIINVIFTLVAMYFIDRVGRKPLLIFGTAGIAISMFIAAYGFHQATYSLSTTAIDQLDLNVDKQALSSIAGTVYDNDVDYKNALISNLGTDVATAHEADLIKAAVDMNPWLILIGILGFVASFAISLGPVMWVLFSEIFPNWIRGLAISVVGFVNSAVSWLVQFIFPWELANLGTAMTFAIYGVFAVIGLLFIMRTVPETKGKSLEELEAILVQE